jgi:periplasmic glucans biosynthesis protein
VHDSDGLSIASDTGAGDKEDLKRFILDFDGGKLKSLPANAALKALISVGQDGQLVEQNIFKNPVTGGWRVAFQVKPPKDKPLQLRAFLQHEKDGLIKDTLTETWSYLLQP